MRITIGTKASEQLRMILGMVKNMDAGYPDPSIEESDEFKVIRASEYPGQNR